VPAYYNEFDPKVAAWLRQLIKNGDIADGVVDERSIIDVAAADLKGFTQHHFFAGVGTWSYALRNAGWADDRPICTASLPCQPFSPAGKEEGKTDERHLLPQFIELVKQCGFDTIIGEQVQRAIKHGWLDDLYDEMEAENYTCGATVLTAAGAGKPHIRQRLYWVANANSKHWRKQQQLEGGTGARAWNQPDWCGEVGGVADTACQRYEGQCGEREKGTAKCFANCGLGNTQNQRPQRRVSRGEDSQWEVFNRHAGCDGSINWLYCADDKYRPIKSGIKPLVNGVARGLVHSCDSIITPNDCAEAKTVRLKGYGNAIVAETATLFIKAVISSI